MESESFERPPLVRAAAAGAAVKRAPVADTPMAVRAAPTGAALDRVPAKKPAVVRVPVARAPVVQSESFERSPQVLAAAAGTAVKRVPVADPPIVVRAPAAGAAVGRAPAVAPKPQRPPDREPEWRQEVSRRLDAYRTRHPRPEEEAQGGLPFSLHMDVIEDIEPEPRPVQEARPTSRPAARAARLRASESVEISVQPELDFNFSRDDRSRPQTALVPVASIEDRRWAGLLDAVFLLATFAGFLGLFRSLGGDILLHKVDAPVYLGAFFLLYAQYFALFTTFAGSTPGMQLRGLYVVRLDGYLPDIRQLVWRSVGYVLSAGTLMLGFLWALWDEEHFTWQDRISQTYVTSGTPLGINESALGQSQQTLGR
jgi:uncharacterized RDD family membrane protein YckC